MTSEKFFLILLVYACHETETCLYKLAAENSANGSVFHHWAHRLDHSYSFGAVFGLAFVHSFDVERGYTAASGRSPDIKFIRALAT